MTSGWFVVRSHPRREEKALLNLERQGFEVYLPRYKKKRRHARRIETVRMALFPCYLFVRAATAVHKWRSIRSTFGVSDLVAHGDKPAVLSSSVVDELRLCEKDGSILLRTHPRFAKGDQVKVTDGAFVDRLGLFDGMRDNERAFVLLDLLGGKVRVLVDELSVTAA